MIGTDIGRLEQRWRAFWARENDTPMLGLTAPRDGAQPFAAPRAHRSVEERWHDVDHAIAQARHGMESTYFGGDAFPMAFPNLGPDLIGAICGCGLRFGEGTSWAEPCVTDWEAFPPISFDENNPWFREILTMTQRMAQDARGDYLVGVADLHPGADALVSLRGPEALCCDLIDCRELLPERIRQVHEVYRQVFRRLSDAIAPVQRGSTNWMGIWRPDGDWYVTSADFAALISPRDFDFIVLPAIEAELELLPASIYHLDGPGALRHLDRLLELDKLNGVQWVQGAGAPPPRAWLEVYKRIQRAGKLVQVTDCPPEDVLLLCRELEPEGLHISCRAGSEQQAKQLEKAVREFYGK
ncbi:MAG: trimethylamine corrinoid protein 2 [Candidatus Spyradocola sp.]